MTIECSPSHPLTKVEDTAHRKRSVRGDSSPLLRNDRQNGRERDPEAENG